MKQLKQLFQRAKNGFSLLKIIILRQLRILRGQPIVHVIGDSHSLLFQDALFQIHYIGPATAHNLGSPISKNNSRQQIINILDQLPKNKHNLVLLVFGEIDARIHIYKTHKEKSITIDQAIEHTLQNYIDFINLLKSQYPSFEFLVFNILPQGEQGNYYDYPVYADRKTRFQITLDMNEGLRQLCRKNSITFIEVFNELIESDNKRKTNLIFDDIHYSNKIVTYIKSELAKKLGDRIDAL